MSRLWIVLLCTVLLELWVLRRLRFDRFIVATVLAGTLVCVNYLAYTSIGERDCDGPSHVEYILSVARTLRLPDMSACGACGHPPLYYLLAALWSSVVTLGGWIPFDLALQWLSLLLFFGFVVFALLIFRSCIEQSTPLRLAAALVVFWPSSIINSVRVHNDALASLLMIASMYFVAQWDRQGRARDFHAALATAALALLTKANGYAVAATLVLFALLRLRSTRQRQSLKQCVAAILVLAVAGGLALGLRMPRERSTICQKVLGHACDGRYVPAVADRPSRFIYFDIGDFVRRIDSVPVDADHDYFLNRFAKSSLFAILPLGSELAGKRHQILGTVISSLLLLMAAICALAVPFLRDVRWRIYRVYVAAAAVMFLFLLAFRIRAPNEFHEDFRHIFPALAPFCLGYVAIVERLGRFHHVLRKAGIVVGLLMVASSVSFFVRLP
jgi:hypothetical protein